jgi:hypothetical protein
VTLVLCGQVISCLRKLDGLVLEQRYLTSTLRGHTATPEAERNELEHNLQVGQSNPFLYVETGHVHTPFGSYFTRHMCT